MTAIDGVPAQPPVAEVPDELEEPVPGDERDNERDDLDDIDADIAAARRKRLGPLTMALALILVAALGVYGGVRLQKSRATTSAAASASATRAAFRGFGGQGGTGATGAAAGATGGAAGTGGAGGGATVGTVKLVDGDTIYVTTQDGNIVKVKTTASGTSITRSVAGTAADLQPGQTVVVQGAADADGTVSATRVTEGAVGAGGRAGAGTGSGGG